MILYGFFARPYVFPCSPLLIVIIEDKLMARDRSAAALLQIRNSSFLCDFFVNDLIHLFHRRGMKGTEALEAIIIDQLIFDQILRESAASKTHFVVKDLSRFSQYQKTQDLL